LLIDLTFLTHQTVKFYRRAILPLPRSMTKYLDELRRSRDPKLGDWVFINTLNEPYTPSTVLLLMLLVADPVLYCVKAAWTSFVKACFGKHSLSSTGQRKAPSASLTRSIFVTWLNGVPYDAHDSPFLQEIKVSAAEYQTHSLAIANRHYDKDVASELRLRELVDFCDKYSAWSVLHPVAAASGQLGRLSVREDNVDSDDEGFESVAPLPRAARPKPAIVAGSGSASSAIDLTLETREGKEAKQEPKETKEARAQAAAAGRARLVQDDDFDDDEGFGSLASEGDGSGLEGKAEEDESLYMPEHIIAKKTVRWKNYYLIHWRGFSESERTWEPAEYFDEYCPAQTYPYHQKRIPVKIVSERTRSHTKTGLGSSAGSASASGAGAGSGSGLRVLRDSVARAT
jgi:hypothetical protein